MEQISENPDTYDTSSMISSTSFAISCNSNVESLESPQIHISPSISSLSSEDINTDDTTQNDNNAPGVSAISSISNHTTNDVSDTCIEQHIEECIHQNQQLFDACCQSEHEYTHHNNTSNATPKYLRIQVDVEPLIKKLAFYIVLFGSFAFVLYEIIQLYVYTMPIEFTIGTLLCFSFLLNFDMHSLEQFHQHIPVLPIPAFSLSSIFSRYKF
jgi:hypothetical protein